MSKFSSQTTVILAISVDDMLGDVFPKGTVEPVVFGHFEGIMVAIDVFPGGGGDEGEFKGGDADYRAVNFMKGSDCLGEVAFEDSSEAPEVCCAR